MRSYQTPDARVLSLLRASNLTRYQIEEGLAEPGHAVDKLLESMWQRELVTRDRILYSLTGRGLAALQLIDAARPVRRVPSEEHERDVLQHARARNTPDLDTLVERLQLMKRGRIRATSEADLRPAPARAGSLKFLEYPSRFGNTLRYRDGRMTDMAGNPL